MTSRPSAPLKKVEQDVVTVRVRCVGCGKTRDAAPEEWKADGVPFCAYCHMPMATVGPVTVKFAQRKPK